MKPATSVILALLFATATLCAASAQAQRKSHSHEQRRFGYGDYAEIKHPVPVPPAVLTLLLQSEQADEMLLNDGSTPDTWFHASVLHLSHSGNADLLIEGSFPMTGADNNWYWIVLSAYKNPRIVLFSGCLEVYVLHHRHNGYQDIKTWWGAGNSAFDITFHFDGKEYKQWKRKDYPAQ